MPLSGKKILITRSAHQARDFVHAIEQSGGTAVLLPTIEIIPPASWEACDRAIESLYMYDGLIFTSVNAVEFFFRRVMEHTGSGHELKSNMVFAVGQKTEQAIEQHGLNVTVMPDKFTAADLSKKLGSEDLHGKTFLFPRGTLGNDTLQDNLRLLGAHVDPVIVYQTVRPQQHMIDEVRASLVKGEFDVATFTSPSTFTNFAEQFSKHDLIEIFKKTKIAVIGPVTGKAVERANFKVDIQSHQSTFESLIGAIIFYFESEIPAQTPGVAQSQNPPSAVKA